MLDRPLTLLAAALLAASVIVAVALVVDRPAAEASPGSSPPVLARSLPAAPPTSVVPAPLAIGPLRLSLRAERSVLAPETVEVRAMAEVQAAEGAEPLAPRPVALAIVVDVSGSMGGSKIADARAGAARLVDRLGDDDLLSIVAFESEVHTVLAPARLGDARRRAASAVEQLAPMGGTCMSCGLDAAYALLAEAPATHDRRVVLFSDGHANEGIVTPEGLAAIVGAARDGSGVASTTVGLGGGYDAPLLNLLAGRGLGSHLFSPGPGAIARILDREIERMKDVIARDVELVLTPAPTVRIGPVDGEVARGPDGSVRVDLGSLSADDRRRLLLPLSIQPGQAGDLVTARLVAAGGLDGDARLQVARSVDPEAVRASLDFDAAGYFAALAASTARADAMQAAASGDRDGARATLQLAWTQLSEVHAQTGLDELQTELDEVSRNLEGIELWTGPQLQSMVNNTAACDLEVRRGVRAEGRWNVAELLSEHEGY